MTCKKMIFTLCFAFIFSSSVVWGDDGRGYAGISISPSVAYDVDSKISGEGLELSMYALIVNVGAGYRHWNDNLFDNENKSFQNEFRLYLGLGLLNIFQAQGGFSSGKRTTMRIQSVLPWRFFFNNADPMDFYVHEPNLIITPYFETDFKNRDIIGICIGYLFI